MLAVSKLGDWTGHKKHRYPVQIIDAMRDTLLNIVFRKIWTSVKHSRSVQPLEDVCWALDHVLPCLDDSLLKGKIHEAGITPAAWASRIARNKAISLAEKSIHMDIEIIGSFLQELHGNWKKTLLELANSKTQLSGADAWDGILWPYDLIRHLADFMRKSSESQPKKLYILLTGPDPGKGDYSGWGDKLAVNEFKERVRAIRGFKPGKKWDEWFKDHCEIKRISNDATMFNHTKVYCIDKKLLYLGSDNPYANYNEEFGVWIEDKTAIDAWFEKSWTPRFDGMAKELDEKVEARMMPPTMV